LQKCCKIPLNRCKIELKALLERGQNRRERTGGMDVLGTAEIFLFEGFRLDRREGLSRHDEQGAFIPVAIGPRALDVLAVLVERSGKLVWKEKIMSAVWGRTVVENANLTVQISTLRRVLDEGRLEGSCIQTVAARGYRFVAPVTRVDKPASLDVAALVEDDDNRGTPRCPCSRPPVANHDTCRCAASRGAAHLDTGRTRRRGRHRGRGRFREPCGRRILVGSSVACSHYPADDGSGD
jgi:DNA-binding winged helix-turn-helix (wHTH) protein